MKTNSNVCVLRQTRPTFWELDYVGSCGDMLFKSVVTVIEPLSKNPGIQVEKPFGLRGMKHAIAEIERVRATYGLTTMQ